MSRDLSIHRRRPGVLILSMADDPNIRDWKLSSSATFDGVYTDFGIIIPKIGYASPNAIVQQYDGAFRGRVLVSLSSTDIPAISDTSEFFMKVTKTTWAGVSTTSSSCHMVVPFTAQTRRAITLSGNAPNAASLAGSLEIVLPQQCQGVNFTNYSTSKDLYTALSPAAAEFRVALSTTYSNNFPTFNSVFVRGDSAVVKFDATFSLRNEAL